MKNAALVGITTLVTMCMILANLVYTRGNGLDWFFFLFGSLYTISVVLDVWLEWA